MAPVFHTLLPGRGVIAVAGPDARTFLQGLITGDMRNVSEARAMYAGLLTPQGKILFDFFVAEADGRFLVDVSRARAAELLKRLGFYKLRARVEIADQGTSHGVAAAWGGLGGQVPAAAGAAQRLDGGVLYRDPRTADAGVRAIAEHETLASLAKRDGWTRSDPATYDAHRISLGLADSDADLGSAEFFPHEANFDQLAGVDFAKGCYVGQEVVSRMEHRGSARKRILIARFSGPAPAEGSEILAGDRAIGNVLSSAGARALALVRLDRAEAARRDGAALTADGRPLALERAPWARHETLEADFAE